MATSRTIIVTETDAYRIERVGPKDFDCFVTGAGYIGSNPTQQAAQARIDQYRYDTMTRAPSELASADDDPFADPRSDEEKRASVEGWVEFAPCDGYPFGGWEKAHVHPFDDARTVMVRKPRLFVAAVEQAA
jgi:hypothetical protein